MPKLFVNGDPGAILTGTQRGWVRTWPNQEEVTVAGIHFLQEDSRDAMGEAIPDWYPPEDQARGDSMRGVFHPRR